MLSITASAEEAIKGILDSPNAPDGAGVRIEAEPGPDGAAAGFRLAVVPSPGEGDEVMADGSVFVEEQAAQMLDDSELGAEVEEGEVQFTLSRRADEPG